MRKVMYALLLAVAALAFTMTQGDGDVDNPHGIVLAVDQIPAQVSVMAESTVLCEATHVVDHTPGISQVISAAAEARPSYDERNRTHVQPVDMNRLALTYRGCGYNLLEFQSAGTQADGTAHIGAERRCRLLTHNIWGYSQVVC